MVKLQEKVIRVTCWCLWLCIPGAAVSQVWQLPLLHPGLRCSGIAGPGFPWAAWHGEQLQREGSKFLFHLNV